MEPVHIPHDEDPATHGATGGDDYLVFFLCSLGSFYVSLALLNKPVVITALRKLIQAQVSTKLGFCFLCCLVALGWIAIMETVVQILVPTCNISSWGPVASGLFTAISIGALRAFVQNDSVLLRLCLALCAIVFPVEAIHYYLVSGCRKCIPLPLLYTLSPIMLILFVRKNMECMGVFREKRAGKKPAWKALSAETCSGADSSKEDDAEVQKAVEKSNWVAEFKAYRRLGRSEVQRLENLALCIDPEFGSYHWDPKAAMEYRNIRLTQMAWEWFFLLEMDFKKIIISNKNMQCPCNTLSAGADNYVVFFLAGLVAYHAAGYFLDERKVLCFLRTLSSSGLYQQTIFALMCCVVAAAWLVLLEYIIQIFVPQFQITNLAGLPVIFLMVIGIVMLSLFVQDHQVTFHLAAAIAMPMLQVAALHFYLISDFRKCVPLPMLYILIPAVLTSLIWKQICPSIPMVSCNIALRKQCGAGAPQKRGACRGLDSNFDYASFNWNYSDYPLVCPKPFKDEFCE